MERVCARCRGQHASPQAQHQLQWNSSSLQPPSQLRAAALATPCSPIATQSSPPRNSEQPRSPDVQDELVGAGAGGTAEQHGVVALQPLGHVVGIQDGQLGGLQHRSKGPVQVGECSLQAPASAAWNRKPAPAVCTRSAQNRTQGGAPGPHSTPRVLASGNQPNTTSRPMLVRAAHVCEALGAHHGDVGKGDGQDEGGAIGRGSHAAKALLWGAGRRGGAGGREVRDTFWQGLSSSTCRSALQRGAALMVA